MLKKIALLAVSLIMVALMLAAVGCGSESTSSVSESVSAKEVVPQRANLIAGLSMSALGDKETGDLYDNMAKGTELPATYDKLLEMVQDKIGLDLRDLKEAVVFADIPADAFYKDENTATESYVGAIVNGSFKRDDIIAAIEKTLGQKLNSDTYKGYDIYVVDYEEDFGISASDAARLAFLGESSLVIGIGEAVKDTIDVRKGDEQGLSGELLNLYEGLGNPQAKLAMEIPAEWLSKIPDEQVVPLLGKLQLNAFKNMRMATLVVDRTGDATLIEIKVDFSNSNSVTDAKETIDGVVSIFQGLMKMMGGQTDMQGMAAIAKLLDSLQLSVNGTWLTLHLELTEEQLGELVPMLQGLSSGD
jgi:hypothetical protein